MPRNLPRHWGGGGVSFLSSVSFIPHGNDSLLHVIFEDKIGSLRHCLLVILQRVYCIFGSYIYMTPWALREGGFRKNLLTKDSRCEVWWNTQHHCSSSYICTQSSPQQKNCYDHIMANFSSSYPTSTCHEWSYIYIKINSCMQDCEDGRNLVV